MLDVNAEDHVVLVLDLDPDVLIFSHDDNSLDTQKRERHAQRPRLVCMSS
jgi:hypothetical protein